MPQTTLELLSPILERVDRSHHWRKTPDGPKHINAELTAQRVAEHLHGGVAVGACPIRRGESTTRLALLDLDSHKGAVPWKEMRQHANTIQSALRLLGIETCAFRSSGGQGIHLFAIWNELQDAYSVRSTINDTLKALDYTPGAHKDGIAARHVEVFPKQDNVPLDGSGNMFVLPGSGRSEPLDEAPGWKASAPVPRIDRPIVERPARDDGGLLATPKLRAALDAIPNAGEHELEYDAWRNVIFAIHHETQGEGLELAHAFSAKSSKYDPDFLDNEVWPFIRSNREKAITGRTIFALAREYGFDGADLNDVEVLRDVQESPARRFQFVRASEFVEGAPPEWLIEGVLPQAELAMMFGESGSGKSFLAIDMAAAIARGVLWRNRPVKAGQVAYIVAEGVSGFRKRLQAYCSNVGVGMDDLNTMQVLGDAPDFTSKTDISALTQALSALGPLRLVVVDTFAKVTAGMNENSGEEVSRVLKHCKAIHEATGALVLLIHHSGKDATRGARGWSGTKAAADAEIEIVRDRDNREAIITKMKDGEDGEAFTFRLIGVDETGSCAVEHVEGAGSRRRRRKLGAAQQPVLDAVREMSDLDPGGLSADVVVRTTVERLPPPDPLKRDRRREIVLEAMKKLVASGDLEQENGRVRLPSNLQKIA